MQGRGGVKGTMFEEEYEPGTEKGIGLIEEKFLGSTETRTEGRGEAGPIISWTSK